MSEAQMNKWKTMCDLLNTTREYAPEKVYQEKLHKVFTDPSYLGWPIESVIREYPIQMGSTKKSDIVLTDENATPRVVIEVKKGKIGQSAVEQLGSYMTLCNPPVQLGMVVGDEIALFYDEKSGKGMHSVEDAVAVFPFDPCNEKGRTFVSLFDFESFEWDAFLEFCQRTMADKEDIKRRNLILKDVVGKLMKIDMIKYLDDLVLSRFGDLYPQSDLVSILEPLKTKVELRVLSKDVINDVVVEKARDESVICSLTHKVPKVYVPSMGEFLAHFNIEKVGYIHYFFKDGRIESKVWKNRNNSINATNVNGNITSRPFYRENKDSLKKIIVSIYKEADVQE